MNQNTWISWITTGIGLAGAAAATNGWISSSTATTVAGAAATLVPLIWGLVVHSDSAVVKAAATLTGGVPIAVGPGAPPAVQALAADASVKEVVPAAPTPSPYAPAAKQRS